jgi:hypothetical protein
VGDASGPRRFPDARREFQPDVLVARLLEFVGAEVGAADPLSREAAFFGLGGLLRHAANLDGPVWERLAVTLTRMRPAAPEAVDEFLRAVAPEHVDRLRREMGSVLPREGINTVLGATRTESFFASVYCEPPGVEGGLRREWQHFLRLCVGPASVSTALREGAQRVLQIMRK